jgi:hypothetical protein
MLHVGSPCYTKELPGLSPRVVLSVQGIFRICDTSAGKDDLQIAVGKVVRLKEAIANLW